MNSENKKRNNEIQTTLEDKNYLVHDMIENLQDNVSSPVQHDKEVEILRESCAVLTCGFLPNGLINSVPHYAISQSNYIKIGIYESENDVALLHSEFQMSAKEFYTVVHSNMWVDSLVIDCYTVTRIDKWKDGNISYMPTDIANKSIGNFAAKRKGTQSEIFKMQTSLKDTLLIPYVFEGHFSLLLVNSIESTVAILDPFKNSVHEDRVMQTFLDYIRLYGEPYALSHLKHILWEKVEMTKRPYQAETNSSNCALYVIYYIYCISNLITFDLNFNSVEYRKVVSEMLILKSKDVSNKCMSCFAESTKTSTKKISTFCKRWIHNK